MPRQGRKRTPVTTSRECGRIIIFEGPRVAMIVRPGDTYLGSRIVASGRWAACNTCGTKHAIGIRCSHCLKEKEQRAREHKNIKKPDNIKGE